MISSNLSANGTELTVCILISGVNNYATVEGGMWCRVGRAPQFFFRDVCILFCAYTVGQVGVGSMI